MDAHIGECHESGFSNRRNGRTSKTMKSTSGMFDLLMLRTLTCSLNKKH